MERVVTTSPPDYHFVLFRGGDRVVLVFGVDNDVVRQRTASASTWSVNEFRLAEVPVVGGIVPVSTHGHTCVCAGVDDVHTIVVVHSKADFGPIALCQSGAGASAVGGEVVVAIAGAVVEELDVLRAGMEGIGVPSPSDLDVDSQVG